MPFLLAKIEKSSKPISKNYFFEVSENALKLKNGRAKISNRKKEKTPQNLDFTAFLASPSGFEPLAYRLGEAPEGHF